MKFKVATLTALGAVALMGNSVAHADETDQPTREDPDYETQALAIEDAEQKQLDKTQAEMKDAKTAAEKQQEVVTDAKQNLNQIETNIKISKDNVNKAQTAVDKAQLTVDKVQTNVKNNPQASAVAQKEAESAVKEADASIHTNNITTAIDAAITEQTGVVKISKDTAKDAETEKFTADNKVSTAVKEKETADKTVTNQQKVVQDAEQAVKDAQDIVNNVGADKIQADNEKAQQTVNSSKQAVADAKKKVESAENKVQNAETALKEATSKGDAAVDAAKAKANKAKAELNKSNQDLAAANKALEDAKQNLANANTSETGNHSRIPLPNGYSKDNFNYPDYKPDNFKDNDNDKNQKLNSLTDLTAAQKEDLSKFAAEVLNDVRKQYGTKMPLVVTNTMISFANDIARAYEADHWLLSDHFSDGKLHDVSAINRVAGRYGLNSKNKSYENYSFGYINTNQTPLTLDSIKKGIYDTIVDMLFDDSSASYLHTISLLGISNNNENSEFFATAIDNMGQIHFIGVKNSATYILDKSKFDETPLPIKETDLNRLTAIFNKAKAKDDQVKTENIVAKKANTLAQEALAKAIKEKETADAKVTQLQTELAKAKEDLT